MSAIRRSSIVSSKSLRSEHSNVTPPGHSDNPDRIALPISDIPAQERSQTTSLNQQDVIGDDGVAPAPSDESIRILKTYDAVSDNQSSTLHKNQETHAQSEDKSIIDVQKRNSDKTSWVHTAALWAFCLCFLGLIAALFVIRHYSIINQGFQVDQSTSSYFWKYAPTAIFAVIIAFWRQVDYRCKVQAPWIEMHRGFASAKNTVLLDCVSPMLPSSMCQSLKNKHFEVSASIAVFALLKVAVLFSTGLLGFHNTALNRQDVLLLLDKGGDLNVSSQSMQYAMSYYGATEKGLEWPSRTGPTAAFQELSSENNLPSDSKVTAEVLAFFPWLNCETATVNYTFNNITGSVAKREQVSLYEVDYTFVTKDCSGSAGSLEICDPVVAVCKPLQILGGVAPTYCPILDYVGDGLSNALVVYLIGVETSQVLAQNSTSTANQTLDVTAWSVTIPWISVLVCSTNYAIEEADLFVDTANPKLPGGTNLSNPLTSTYNTIDGYTYGNLTLDFQNIISFGSATSNNIPSPIDSLRSETTDYSGVDSFFGLMMFEASVPDVLAFRDPSLMSATANKVFNGLTSQWVGSWLSFPNNLSTHGSYTYSESRLQTHEVSLWGMAIALALAVLCTILILSLHNPFVLPWQNDGFFSRAFVLKRSQKLHETCQNLGHLSDRQLEYQLSGSSFTLLGRSHYSMFIEPQLNEPTPLRAPEKGRVSTPGNMIWWSPLPSKIWFSAISIGMPLATIVSLEVLQRISDANGGISDVKSSTSVGAAMSTYVPALVMLVIATLFGCAEFATCLLAPHLAMKRGLATASMLISTPLRQLPPIAILGALSSGRIAASVVMISALVGSVLSIVSSGLYNIEAVPKIQMTTVMTEDQFYLQWNHPLSKASAAMFTLVQAHNASYPSGTHDEIAFPLFALDKSDPMVLAILQSQNQSTIEVQMPITRPSLNCTIVSEADMMVQVGHNTYQPNDYTIDGPYANITTTSMLPKHCQFSPGAYETSTQMELQTTHRMSLDPGEVLVAGELEPPLPPGGQATVEVSPYAPDCPSVGLTFGKFKIDDTVKDGITMLICSQYQEEIPATLTFSVPSLFLDPSRPPVLHEEGAKVVRRTSYNFQSLFGS